MSTWAVTTIKDEADVIEGTIRHMLDEVDGVLVCDNGSTDDTPKILHRLVEDCFPRLRLGHDEQVGYYQSQRMSDLAMLAAQVHGAEWIVPFDADELWVGLNRRIKDDLAAYPGKVMTAELFNYFPSAVDPGDPDPFRSIQWRQRQPAPLPKVAFRWEPGAVIHQGNHGVTLPSAGQADPAPGLRVLHFPYRSVEQFIRKARNGAAAYKATDLPADVGAHWRGYGEILERHGEEALGDVFRQYFWNLSPADAGMLLDPAPYMRWR